MALSKELYNINSIREAYNVMQTKACMYMQHPFTINLLAFTEAESLFHAAMRAYRATQNSYE